MVLNGNNQPAAGLLRTAAFALGLITLAACGGGDTATSGTSSNNSADSATNLAANAGASPGSPNGVTSDPDTSAISAFGGASKNFTTTEATNRCAQAGTPYDVYSTTNAHVVGRPVNLALGSCSGAISSISWTQISGPPVSLLSNRSQVIIFEPLLVGTYVFSANFVDGTGTARSLTATVPVATTTASTKILVRNSHAVRMGSDVSLRAWPRLIVGETIRSITWIQLEGPPVTLNTTDDLLVTFTAPPVPRDTAIRVRASIQTSSGATDAAEVLVMVERYAQADTTNPNAIWDGLHVSRVHPYLTNGAWANVLSRCVFDANSQIAGAGANLCPLSTLPFLAQETGGTIPTVEQVMARVLVSHDWLGRNFETFLRTHDTRGDFRRMLNSVTAVVLGSHIRPSFYYAVSGAIYLDAENLWLTAPERDTINEAPDFRSNFDQELAFETPWRYVQNGQSISVFFDPRGRFTRTIDHVRNELAPLLYHELGHALDFLPPSQYSALNNVLSVWDNVSPRYAAGQLPSDQVSTQFPLTSTEMRLLGNVMYRGATATALQRSYTPDQVAGFFQTDLATDDYAYSDSREDAATTLEEFLMSRRLGIARDFAVTDKITSSTTASNFFVRWGQRGRVGEAAIKPRIASLVSQLTPWMPPSEIDLLPAPLAMRAGDTWDNNLALPAPLAGRAVKSELGAEPEFDFAAQMREQTWQKKSQRRRQHLHDGAPALPPR